jgi:hypothetical protein
VRLDAATACRCAACLAPPPEGVTTGHLEHAIRQAVSAVRVPCPPLDDDPAAPVRYARWGAQLDVRNVTRTQGEDPGELSAAQVAAYLAKYATKATESFGTRLDRRIGADDLATLDQQLPGHVAALVRACWELGGHPGLEPLRLRRWAHMLGFRGHWQTKSRYSVTMTVLRRARAAYARKRRARDGVPLDAWTGPRTTSSSRPWPPGPTSVGATRPRERPCWRCRLPRGPGSGAASLGRN